MTCSCIHITVNLQLLNMKTRKGLRPFDCAVELCKYLHLALPSAMIHIQVKAFLPVDKDTNLQKRTVCLIVHIK